MTLFHHILFEMLLWELPGRYFIQKRCDHRYVVARKCARMSCVGFASLEVVTDICVHFICHFSAFSSELLEVLSRPGLALPIFVQTSRVVIMDS